jgi:hypothetical protein
VIVAGWKIKEPRKNPNQNLAKDMKIHEQEN